MCSWTRKRERRAYNKVWAEGYVKGNWKYIKQFNEAPQWAKVRLGKYPLIGYIEMLFNLDEDIAEQTNLANENLDKLAEMRAEYEQWRKSTILRHRNYKMQEHDQYGDGNFQ